MESYIQSKTIKYSSICFKIITIISAIVLLICLFGGTFFVELKNMSQNSVCNKWDAKWYIRDANEEELEFLKENKVNLEGRDIMVFSAMLPEDSKYHMYLLTSIVYSDTWFYVGDESFECSELRYVFYPESETDFAKTGYSARRTIPLYDEDKDKFITIIQVADDKENFIYNGEITYGDKYGLLWNHISENRLTFITNVVLLVLSCVSLIICFGAMIIMRKSFPVIYLIIGVFFLAIWAITNSFTMELFFDNWHIMHDLLYFADFATPLAMMLYLDSVQEKRYSKIYFIFEIIYVPVWLLAVVLYITNICSMHDFFMNTMPFVMAMVICMFVTSLMDVFRKKIEKYKYVLIGFGVAAVCVIIQIVSYFINNTQMTLPYISLGVIVILLMCVFETAQEVLNAFVEKAAALSASKAKSDVLAKMSHEIRTPINAILGMNEMILRSTNELETGQYAKDVRNATNNLLEIVNEILDFSKIESGKMELTCVEYNLAKLIDDVVNMFTIRARDKGLEFIADIDESLPAGLYGDDVKIRQILANLLSNAVKYTPNGNIRLEVNGKVFQDNVNLSFMVKDTGIGIKPEDRTKLFTEFERIEDSQNRGIEGTGLGMSITIRFLKMMDSELSVDSVYGEGSEFYFDLKQRVVNTETIGVYQKRQNIDQAVEKEYKTFTAPDAGILVVDDNKMNLKVFCSLLKVTKINIDTAESGEECLELVKKNSYNMIFLDHMMPEMDGVETLHRLKKLEESKCKNVPVIALTANAVSGAREFYLSEGFDAFMSKPFNPEALESMILTYLSKEYVVYDSQISESAAATDTDLPEIEGIDWEYGLSHFNDKESMFEMMEDFYYSITNEADKLNEFYDKLKASAGEDEFKQYRVQVHSMKSMANLIGAVKLGAMAKELEDAANTHDLEFILKANKNFIKEWSDFKMCFKRLFRKKPKEKEFSFTEMRESLNELKAAFETMDLDKMDIMIGNLLQYEYPEYLVDDFERLKACVVDLDAENGIATIEIIKQKTNVAVGFIIRDLGVKL